MEQRLSLLIICLLTFCVLALLLNRQEGCETLEHRVEVVSFHSEAPASASTAAPAAPTQESWTSLTTAPTAPPALRKPEPPAPPPAPPPRVAPAAPTAAVQFAQQKKLKLAFARFPKTGSRYAIQKFRTVVGKDLLVVPEASALHSQYLPESFVVGSVRNPCESYLSLWAFQSDPMRHAGLMYDLRRKSPKDYLRLVGLDAASNFTSQQDVQRFRDWIRFLAHGSVKIGLLSGRFYGKYISRDPKLNIRDNAMLVKEVDPTEAQEMVKALQQMDVDQLVNCWLHTETMDEDLRRCLDRFSAERGAARGAVKLDQLEATDGSHGESHHGRCEVFFDAETEALVRELDGPLFTKFGYQTCCVKTPTVSTTTAVVTATAAPVSGTSSSAPSSSPSPWSWGDPFATADGRPSGRHSGASTWPAKVGPCEREVSGPNERSLGTAQMLTLPTIRMALDEEILQCLSQMADGRLSGETRKAAQAMMYQCILSGLPRSCGFLAQRLNYSPVEPLSLEDVTEIMTGNKRRRGKGLSVFQLTGFTGRWTHAVGKNLVQLAVWMGHADLVNAILPTSRHGEPIDTRQRTVLDYVSAPGSPVYNWPWSSALGAAVGAARHRTARPPPTGRLTCNGESFPELSLGWTEETAWDHYYACDFEVVDSLTQQDFEDKFRDLGRPVLVRNWASVDDRCKLQKQKVLQAYATKRFNLGPIAYPNLIGAKPCEKQFTVEEAEKGAKCEQHGNTSNYHASHDPGILTDDLTLSPTFQKVKELLPRINRLSKQYFWGGDQSGAALHYHVSAFNALFIGEKEWYVTPPYLAARSGISTYELFHRPGINEQHLFRCTQYAGDLVLLPDGWGHATLNHGFGVGIGVLYDES